MQMRAQNMVQSIVNPAPAPDVGLYIAGFEDAKALIVARIRTPNEDGTPCSADREVLARIIERGNF